MRKKNLHLSRIDLSDERYRISFYFTLDKMIRSLKRVGLINPPLVAYQNGHYVLVSGWKRVLACLEISFSSIPVMLVERGDELQYFLMAFYENLSTRSFSAVEKAEVIRRLRDFGVEKALLLREYLPLLGIPSSTVHYEVFLELSRFEPQLKKIIHEKEIPFHSLRKLSEIEPEARKHVFPIVLPLSRNKQKEILEDLHDISQRESCPVEEVLKSEEIQEIMSSGKWSSIQKAEKIRLFLRKKRFPTLSSWEKAFNASLKKLKWPGDIGIEHAPFFEDEDISVTFSFRNRKEFEEKLFMLQRMASRREFSSLFKQ